MNTYTPALNWLTEFVMSVRPTRMRISVWLFDRIQLELDMPPLPNPGARYQFCGVPVDIKG